ncbi:hypothetical protein [Paraglaciecola sp. 20A4]|uniref:hypothetical protein n=1 Tax=Paraglaciecola sp. 20A4 TaxID=2687288 RepID=UPI001408D40D|nr:hypothetical protein [Paraglaciecola sp. 20A4]
MGYSYQCPVPNGIIGGFNGAIIPILPIKHDEKPPLVANQLVDRQIDINNTALFIDIWKA